MNDYKDFVRARDVLERSDVHCPNINFYWTGTEKEYIKFINTLGRLSQQEEETMNDNLNTNNATEFKPVPLTDAELQKLLETKPGEPVAYVTDADEAADEPTPTIH